MNCMNDGRLTDLYEMSSSSLLCTKTERTSVSSAEFTSGPKSLWISHRRYSTKLRKFLQSQQPTKLSGFMRDSGEFLLLFIFLLLTVVDAAVLTFSMLMYKLAVCKSAKHSQTVVNCNRISDISYTGHSNSSTVTSFYNLTPQHPQLWPQLPATLKYLHSPTARMFLCIESNYIVFHLTLPLLL